MVSSPPGNGSIGSTASDDDDHESDTAEEETIITTTKEDDSFDILGWCFMCLLIWPFVKGQFYELFQGKNIFAEYFSLP